ncbi:protein containing DUF721 [Candidatus Thiomargarita nelsonii]|uniref:Protein containing DUF721 n=1 Tax=Candidatus Thiomargarita nelsonii TaxID=1003181 RepID=A0A176RTP3_9GAMM|nr:protein containing DUF721 [Candidatus Thiomargarita nelsonii]
MKSFSQLIANPSGVLKPLLQHIQTIKQLDKIFQASLSSPLNQHCHVANFRQKILVVQADSSIWGTQLRYMVPKLLQQWQQDNSLPTIEQIEVRVRPSDTTQ